MKKTFALIFWSVLACAAHADGAAPANNTPSSGMSAWFKQSYQGDVLCTNTTSLKVYPLDYFLTTTDLEPPDASTHSKEIRGGGCIRVIGEIDFAQLSETMKTKVTKMSSTNDTSLVYVKDALATDSTVEKFENLMFGAKDSGLDGRAVYVTTRDAIENYSDVRRWGLAYGILVTPFKYYPGNARKPVVASQTTIGGYVGARMWDFPGVSGVIAFAAGPVSTSVTVTAANGSTSTANVNGVSVAIAELWEIKEKFMAGFMIGRDFYTKIDNADNPINARWWLGVNLGAAF